MGGLCSHCMNGPRDGPGAGEDAKEEGVVAVAASSSCATLRKEDEQYVVFRPPRCVACLVEDATQACVPCGHVVTCKKCAQLLEAVKAAESPRGRDRDNAPSCMVCRGRIESVVHLIWPEAPDEETRLAASFLLDLNDKAMSAIAETADTLERVSQQAFQSLERERDSAATVEDVREVSNRLQRMEELLKTCVAREDARQAAVQSARLRAKYDEVLPRQEHEALPLERTGGGGVAVPQETSGSEQSALALSVPEAPSHDHDSFSAPLRSQRPCESSA